MPEGMRQQANGFRATLKTSQAKFGRLCLPCSFLGAQTKELGVVRSLPGLLLDTLEVGVGFRKKKILQRQ